MDITRDIISHYRAQRFLSDYAACLDEDRLEDWPDFFEQDTCYKVLSRENVEQGLPAPLIYHYSRGMLQDRVTAIRDALTFEYVHTRHLISDVRVTGERDGITAVTAAYAVFQSTEEGRTRLFSVGRYEAGLVLDDGPARFRFLTVVVDTFAIENLLAVPL